MLPAKAGAALWHRWADPVAALWSHQPDAGRTGVPGHTVLPVATQQTDLVHRRPHRHHAVLPIWGSAYQMFHPEFGWWAKEKYLLLGIGVVVLGVQIWIVVEGLVIWRRPAACWKKHCHRWPRGQANRWSAGRGQRWPLLLDAQTVNARSM